MALAASDVMGHSSPDAGEPITKVDKLLSKAHKKHRADIDKIPNQRQRLIQSNSWNRIHAKDHLKQVKKNMKSLAKMS
jgi:hypothetical protein